VKFIHKDITATHLNTSESYSDSTVNDAKELIHTKITKTMIHTSEFARDINDEVCVLMFTTDTPYYIPLYSRETSAVIYWIGLENGVKLEISDINKVIDDLQHYVVIDSGNAEFMEETFQSMGVCQ